jgi:hypothetical protein
MYTQLELQAMTLEEFNAARTAGFYRPEHRAVEESSVPPAVQPSANVWASRAGSTKGRDFVCPSGQTCKMRPLEPQQLLQAGMLDKVSRLEGLADTLVKDAEGVPPEKQQIPSREDLALLLETIDQLVLLAVVEPKLYSDDLPDADVPSGGIRIGDVDLVDRMAIMEESMKGVKALDRFRHA